LYHSGDYRLSNPSNPSNKGLDFMDSSPLFHPDDARALECARACPHYRSTELTRIDHDGVTVMVKDESTRFGLGSFKALGGVHAVAQLLLEQVEEQTGSRPRIEDIKSEAVRKIAATQTFVCASAGNHGMAVAAGARLFGANARVHVSAEVPADFVQRLQELGCEARVSGATYEESLKAAEDDARSTQARLLADGSWAGYTHPPGLVMEGYTVMAAELREVFDTSGQWPSDVYLQAGVGGMAAAVTHMIRTYWSVQPRIVIVEPEAADCLALSAAAGYLVEAIGPVSKMGRLDCKAASLLAFDTLQRSSVHYMTISDDEAAAAVTDLSMHGLHTTPSGGAGFAAWQRELAAGFPVGSSPLIFMSEQAI
jgi:diaminopropionate ammonia-lyase